MSNSQKCNRTLRQLINRVDVVCRDILTGVYTNSGQKQIRLDLMKALLKTGIHAH